MTSSKVPPIGIVKGKKPHIRKMFDAIAPRYDFLNRVLSGGIDQSWRKKVIKLVDSDSPNRVLDVATGTGDLAIMGANGGMQSVIGVDISEEMLEVGRRKVLSKGLNDRVELQTGDAEKLPFSDQQFDAAMVAFGVRNFEDLAEGLNQICRVLKPGGRLVVLEFSQPKSFPIKQLYTFYGRYILPVVGQLISGDSAAYTYLPESIAVFPEGNDFLKYMEDAGFSNLLSRRLTFGIASIYSGTR